MMVQKYTMFQSRTKKIRGKMGTGQYCYAREAGILFSIEALASGNARFQFVLVKLSFNDCKLTKLG